MIKFNARDREFWEQYLEDFVPRRLYDMHTHLWTEAGQNPAALRKSALRMEAGLNELRRWSGEIYPRRECHYLLLGTPVTGIDRKNHNRWLAGEVKKDPLSAAAHQYPAGSTRRIFAAAHADRTVSTQPAAEHTRISASPADR